MKKRTVLFYVLVLMVFMFPGCSNYKKTDEFILQESSVETEYTEEIVSEVQNVEKDTDVKDADVQAAQYPILLMPTLTSNIDFALFSEDIFCICNGGKYGYMKLSGEEITDYIYDAGFPFSEGLACVILNGKYGYIDTEGEVAIPFVYEDAAPFTDGLAYFATEEEYGYMKKDGKVAFYLDCDSASSFQEGLAYISINGKYGYIDKTGQIVIEPIFGDADYFEEGIAFVSLNGCKGAINTKGEEVIPTEYDNIYRSDGVIVAEIGEEKCYYSLSGEAISQEEYKNKLSLSNVSADKQGTMADLYEITREDGIFSVDKNGERILSIECDYDSHSIYGDYRNYILEQYDTEEPEYILLLEDNKNVDISDILLKNSITPRIKQYWRLTHGKSVDVVNGAGDVVSMNNFANWCEYVYVKKARIIALEPGKPILYCYEEPAINYSFPMSDSAFYAICDGQVHCLVTGYECGGSSRGDYVCLWKNTENSRILLGIDGAVGGFGGFSCFRTIYDNREGKVQEIYADTFIRQDTGNYKQEELIENAALFYNEDNIPYTAETIQAAEYVTEYIVNEKHVSTEEYEKASKRYVLYDMFN